MLKALELYGFKSFADRTRFDFPEGITVIVGPNGSGKSNVVDAIKWVLGEQSAKNLRGKDMHDVIFKGSGATRKPMAGAEASLFFDNSRGLLDIDVAEVQITRRVYAGGEGEYLINRQPSRLKDVRDLFRGTGAGSGAYSMIEQGRVDKLLQASSKERRAIFEEAAGISRFKAKKIEAQRRLERVDQNLLRLSDIVEEVETRLRAVKSQANKAEKYRELNRRLQELRMSAGLADWRRLSRGVAEAEGRIAELSQGAEANRAERVALETNLTSIERDFEETVAFAQRQDAALSQLREKIVALESSNFHLFSQLETTGEERRRFQEQRWRAERKAQDLAAKLGSLDSERSEAEERRATCLAAVDEKEREVAALHQALQQAREENETRREEYVAAVRETGELGKRISTAEAALNGAGVEEQRLIRELDAVERGVEQLDQEIAALEQEEALLVARRTRLQEQIDVAQSRLVDGQKRLDKLQQQIHQSQAKILGLEERLAFLDGLERAGEGLSEFTTRALKAKSDEPAGAYASVRGLLADFVRVDFEHAPLADLALGERTTYLVVDDVEAMHRIAVSEGLPTSRIGFVALSTRRPRYQASRANSPLRDAAGVIGRADELVRAAEPAGPLLRRLLAEIWFVADLPSALALQDRLEPGERLVTADGYSVSTDNVFFGGGKSVPSGLVARRSERSLLARQLASAREEMTETSRQHAELQEEILQGDLALKQLHVERAAADEETSEVRTKGRVALDRLERRREQLLALDRQRETLQDRRLVLAAEMDEARARYEEVETKARRLDEAVRRFDEQFSASDTERQQRLRELTVTKVELARSEQVFETIQRQHERMAADLREARSHADEAAQAVGTLANKADAAERSILEAEGRLSLLFLEKEALAARLILLAERRDELQAARRSGQQSLTAIEATLRELTDSLHREELALGQTRQERDILHARMKEDYDVDLQDLAERSGADGIPGGDAAEEEIATLRRKINQIGTVNLEALAELDELEPRYAALSAQYEDLKQAKESLERIIRKINADSRKLFQETLEAIRANFQTLYRKVFGGGRADLALEEGADVLESGIEIVATPPGKSEFSNSLLSGGEKALTAVALLLAIFQYRPSPFCILDEVDAPFDEANIGRFIDTLGGFLGFTRFVIITHSKKTMTAATTLYGVTMQESGVSKRVSVRFEDVADDGRILPTAGSADASEEAA
ncbi:MAG TPA: chromosome segregation protein SMC [Pirellulaceae bacterium]|jgi:chromosome segregation protein|nr:chromosome segregation protein SMC [Pirellulaceae bacterium]